MARKTVTIPIPERAEKLVQGAEKTLGNLGSLGKLFGDAAKAFRDPVRGIVEGFREAKAGLDDVLPRRQIDRVGDCPACGGVLERKYGGSGDRIYCSSCCASFPDRNPARSDPPEDRHEDDRGRGASSARGARIEDDDE